MSSWRDTTSSDVQDDLDQLMSAGLELAEQQLGEHGEFYPFAMTFDLDGEGALVAGDPTVLGETPQSDAVLGLLKADLSSGRGAIRAVALVADVLIDGQDAVRVELEHRDGVALVVAAPYQRIGKQIGVGDIRASAGSLAIWS